MSVPPPEVIPSEAAAPVAAADQEIFKKPNLLDHLFYNAIWSLGYVASFFYLHLRIRNRRVVPGKGPVLLVSNHSSHLDPPLVGFSCMRRVLYLAKAELFEVPVIGRSIRSLGAFPIRRGGGDRAALRVSIELLRAGNCLLMFPEGSRSQDGALREAQNGVAMLLNQVPEALVVPLRIDGSYASWPPGKKFPRPSRVTITYGVPFRVADLPNLPTEKKRLYREIGEETMRRIATAGNSAPKTGSDDRSR